MHHTSAGRMELLTRAMFLPLSGVCIDSPVDGFHREDRSSRPTHENFPTAARRSKPLASAGERANHTYADLVILGMTKEALIAEDDTLASSVVAVRHDGFVSYRLRFLHSQPFYSRTSPTFLHAKRFTYNNARKPLPRSSSIQAEGYPLSSPLSVEIEITRRREGVRAAVAYPGRTR